MKGAFATMTTFVSLMDRLSQYSFGREGNGWVVKSDLLESYPRSMPVAYNHFREVSKCFEHRKEGQRVFIRVSPDIDWAEELNSTEPMHDWAGVSAAMNAVLQSMERIKSVELMLENYPDFFKTYAGTTSDLLSAVEESISQANKVKRMIKVIA